MKLYGFITQWHVCAGFDNTGGKGFATSYPPEKKIELSAVVPGKDGKSVKWSDHVTTDKMGAVDLNKVIGREKNVVAYGLTVIDSPDDRPVEIRAASATAVKIFLNGQEDSESRIVPPEFFGRFTHRSGTTQEGEEHSLDQGVPERSEGTVAQEWRFQVRVTDAVGTPVPISVEPLQAKEGTGSWVEFSPRCSCCSSAAGRWRAIGRNSADRPATGIGTDTGLPESSGPTDNLKWKAPLPGRGVSCPVIVGNRLFVTASSGLAMTRLHVLGYDADSGERLWERQFWATGQTLCHPKTCMAGPTPVTDGKHVWCFSPRTT